MKKLTMLEILIMMCIFMLFVILLGAFKLLTINSMIVIAISLVVIFISIFCYSFRYSTHTFYNVVGQFVEFHIGRTTSKSKVRRNFRNAMKVAKEQNCNIVFFTTHRSEEKLKESYGERIEVKKANVFQMFCYYLPYFLITLGLKKKKDKLPLLRCELLIRKEKQRAK